MINWALIKQRRNELGWTQGELAEIVSRLSGEKISQQGIAKLEKGGTKLSGHLPYVCVALQIDLSDIDGTLDLAMKKRTASNMLDALRNLPAEEQAAFLKQAIQILSERSSQ